MREEDLGVPWILQMMREVPSEDLTAMGRKCTASLGMTAGVGDAEVECRSLFRLKQQSKAGAYPLTTSKIGLIGQLQLH